MPNDNNNGTATATTTASNGQRRPSSADRRNSASANPDMNLTGIGNYSFQRTIGQGNFAKVKLAKHKLTGQEVAIKIIDKTNMDEKKLAKLHREVRIMKMLNHPNIVKLYEVIETRHTLFLVMEYVSGGELYDYLVAHGRMKEKEARAKFRQILSAVNYCHKKRVIHRDLKAENILLDDNLNIKVADFGFSNQYNPDGQLETYCGSPPYASPELFQGRKYTGPEVDVWSLGVILYVLCTGCLPFDGNSLKEIREVVCRGKYKIPYYLSEKCELLLRKFLVRDPTKRASLDMLVEDQWINEGYPDSPILPAPQDPITEPDEDVIRYLTDKYSIPRDQIINCLKEGVYDDVTAIYFLTVDQKANGKLQLNAPLSPIGQQLQLPSPTSRRVSQNSNAGMGAIGEDEDESAIPSIEVRGRSKTSGPTPQPRPVTWMGVDAARQQQNNGNNNNFRVEVTTAGGDIVTQQQQQYAAAFQAPIQAHHNRRNTQPILPSAALTAAVQNVQNAQQQQQQQRQQSSQGQQSQQQPQQKTGFMTSLKAFTRRISESYATGSPQALAMQQAAAAAAANQAAANGEDKPRALRFTFNSTTTSTKPPEEIMKSLIQTCNSSYIKFTLHNRFLIECTWNFKEHRLPKNQLNSDQNDGQKNSTQKNAEAMDMDHLQRALNEVMRDSNGNLNNNNSGGDIVRFEIEVCELPRLKNLHGLRFRRIAGPAEEYRLVCEHVLTNVRL